MAVHEFCEPNRANWCGIRPGLDGEEIVRSGYVNGTTVTLYTVPANKIFLLFNVHFSSHNYVIGPKLSYLYSYTSGAAPHYIFYHVRFDDKGVVIDSSQFFLPIAHPAGYYFTLYSAAANLNSTASISGILIDA